MTGAANAAAVMDKTDRELLDLAAKAAGLRLGWWEMESLECIGPYVWSDDRKTTRWWNPLTDDGDALRLAVRLSASIVFVVLTDGPMVQVSLTWNDSFEGCRWNEWLGDAPAAATRRAIVRAAAAIGESMQ